MSPRLMRTAIHQLILPVALLFFASTACNNADQAAAAPVEKKDSAADFHRFDTALSFSGLWVNRKYVEELNRTRSPLTAQVPEYSCIIIPPRTLMETTMIFGFHEGGEAVTVLKNGERYELWEIENRKKWQNIHLSGDGKMEIAGEVFVKLRGGDVAGTNNPFNIVDIVLFKGKFRNPEGGLVEFTDDGKVKGLSGNSFYEVRLDYADQYANLDELSLGAELSALKPYVFRFDQDTLRVYEKECKKWDQDSVCVEAIYGKPYLTLIKEM